jgi:erythromycin esterase
LGWFGVLARPDLFEIGTDAGIRRTGTASGYLTAKNGSPGSAFVAFSQSVSAVDYRGKRIRFTGWVRADSVSGSGGGLWLRVDGPTRMLAFDNMIGYNRAIRGTADWAQYSIVLDVPQQAVIITLGSLLGGLGTLRLDDARLDVVDMTVPTTVPPETFPETTDSAATVTAALRLPSVAVNLDFEGLPATESAWLATVARPFATDAPGSGFDDLAELGDIVGAARVVGFGEATHGTREFFRMKHRAFEYLVERQGFTHFTIEATMPESRAMDRYVTRGEGDPARLLSNLYFWTWNTEEVLDLVRWMRAYNVRVGAPRLRFFGFDMQSPQHAIDSARVMLTRLEPALGARAASSMACLEPGRSAQGTYDGAQYRDRTTLAQKQACGDSLQALVTSVAAARPRWSDLMSAEDLDWLEQYVLLVRQWERLAQATTNAFFVRDRAMADNLLWIATREPSAKLFAWAHNAHVARSNGAMGGNLGQALGDAYRVFGFTFGTGSFNAVGSTGTTFTGLTPHTIGSVTTGTLESIFAATAQPRLIFDARRIASGGDAAAALRGQVLRMRSIGAVYAVTFSATYFAQTLLPQDYDAVIWFANTTPSILLPFR